MAATSVMLRVLHRARGVSLQHAVAGALAPALLLSVERRVSDIKAHLPVAMAAPSVEVRIHGGRGGAGSKAGATAGAGAGAGPSLTWRAQWLADRVGELARPLAGVADATVARAVGALAVGLFSAYAEALVAALMGPRGEDGEAGADGDGADGRVRGAVVGLAEREAELQAAEALATEWIPEAMAPLGRVAGEVVPVEALMEVVEHLAECVELGGEEGSAQGGR